MAKVTKRKWVTAKGEQKEAWKVDYKSQAGKRCSKHFERKKDADAYLRQVEDEVRRGMHTPDSETITLGKAITDWLEDCAARHRRKDNMSGYGLRSYRQASKDVLTEIGHLRLNRPDVRLQLQAFINKKAEANKSGMLQAIRVVINQTLKHAVHTGLMNYNPLRDHPLKLPTRPFKQIEIPTKEEAHQLLAALANRPSGMRETNYRNAIMSITMAMFAPMRRGEICGLWWENIDWDADEIEITHSQSQFDGRKTTKTTSSTRRVPMLPPLRAALLQHAAARGDEMTGYVLVSEDGRPVSPDTVTIIYWPRISKAANLTRPSDSVNGGYWRDHRAPKFHFHSLRHFGASILIEQGIDPYRLMKVMGHKDIKVTYNVYGHMFPSDQTIRDKMALGLKQFAVPQIEDRTSVTRLSSRNESGRAQVATLRRDGKTTSAIARELGVQRQQVYAWDAPGALDDGRAQLAERNAKIVAMHAEGISMPKIARAVGLSAQRVWHVLLKKGETPEKRQAQRAERDAKIVAMRQSGISIPKIAAAVGMNITAVHRRLELHGMTKKRADGTQTQHSGGG